MGKTKTKYPVEIQIEFVLPLNDQTYVEKQVQLKIHVSPLKYQHIKKPYDQFLEENNIQYPTVMEYIVGDQRQQIVQDFEMQIPKFLEQFGGRFTIIVQNYMQSFMDQINIAIDQIRQQIDQIRERLNDFPTRQQIQLIRKNSIPVLHQNQSTVAPSIYQQKGLDIGVLFSQPIFDQIRKKTAATPVDFQSQIQRLHVALKSSMKSDITIKCEIATKQNLKHLIKYSKPKILHIICHGTKEGALQFQDDSRTVLGALQIVNTDEIMDILRNVDQRLPQVVFINSCYSEHVGQIFFKMGVNYVIMIDSQDTIEDEAAQIFSQHFYRNIFSGQKISQAFKAAKQRVQMKHNSSGCCCRHSSKQKHKQNCRWIQMIWNSNTKSIDEHEKLEKHRLFHVPSQSCKCELKNLNRHKLNCEWAKQTLFNINNDFRILDQNGVPQFPKVKSDLPKYLPKDELVICCCFNYQGDELQGGQFRMPHSESNKFKMLQNSNKQKSQSIFVIVPSSYKQLNDYTAPQLLEAHQKIQSSIEGRQKQIYDFIKKIKDINQAIYIVYGRMGVGRTSFALKCVTYLIKRRVYEMYFYIDLYGIQDKDIFRYKFNEITKFNYDGEVKIKQVKNKMIIIILDNADDFFEHAKDQFCDQLINIKQQLHKIKLIVTFKEENVKLIGLEKRIHSENFYLDPLSVPVATRLIFSKMRHLFDTSVQYLEIDGLVRSNQLLRIPKIIESICQSFSTIKKKLKVSQIKKKLEGFVQDEGAGTKLIEQNLQILKDKCKQSYELLLFISQFSEGISVDDFKMLSIYDKKDSKIHLPINKNWQQHFLKLFQKIKVQQYQKQSGDTSSVATQESQLSYPKLKNFHSINPKQNIQQTKVLNQRIKGQSYYLDEVSQNKFIVKRYIRDFIFKKHRSDSNNYMKLFFIGYMAVMLEIYFKWLIESRYIHEGLIEYSAISEAGFFKLQNNVTQQKINLTESMKIRKIYNSEFERLIHQSPTILQKIKKSDPSVFITNHKQDFLNIYQKKWDEVFEYFKTEKKDEEKKILMGYLLNLMIFIPTAFKIAKVETSLLRYVISKSMNMVKNLQSYSQQKKILINQLKLQLMGANIEIQSCDIENLKLDLDFNKQYTIIKLLQKIDKQDIQSLKKNWFYQRDYLLIYKQYIDKKQLSKILIQKSKVSGQKLKILVDIVSSYIKQGYQKNQEVEPILLAKRNLLIGLIFLYVLKNSLASINIHASAIKFKKDNEKIIQKMVEDSFDKFKSKDLIKLCLRAKLTAIQLYNWQYNQRKKGNIVYGISFYEQLSLQQKNIVECQKIYTDRKNNLIAYAQFEGQIKALKKGLKQRLWQQSSNTLVCMRAVPITTNGKQPVKQNLSRKKNRFRKQIQSVLNPQKDLCAKFEILTQNKLKQQLQNGCTILLISLSIKIKDNIPYLVFEGDRMDEDLVEVNQQFIQKYNMNKIKVLIIAGLNSRVAITQLSKMIQDPPIMISLDKNNQQEQSFYQFKQTSYQNYENYEILDVEEKRKYQLNFMKQFVKRVIQNGVNSKEQIVKICNICKQSIKKSHEVYIEYMKRVSPLKIQSINGTYKDLSPGYQKNHNIDMQMKSDSFGFVALRRWKQTYRVFQYLKRCLENQKDGTITSQPAYINIFGDLGSGKSCFIEEIARILVERQKFSSGVYIVQGKILQKKYQGQFQSYFNKQSQSGKIIKYDDFQNNADEKMMLIIDDFHYIKPRSNGRFNLFLQKLIERQVNLIMVTSEVYQNGAKEKKQSMIFRKIKPIKIQKMNQFEIDLIAVNTLDLTNKKLLQTYRKLRSQKQGRMQVAQLIELKKAFYDKKKNEYQPLQNRKMISNYS